MHRRAYLTALGAAAAAVSGCSEGDSTGTATTTDTAADGTATPTERGTATPEQPDPDPTPSVTDAGLLLDRGEYATLGDIDSVGQGGPLVVGVEYDLPASEGSARGLVETRVFDDQGTRLETNTTEVDVVADGDSVSRRAWFAFDTIDWEQGSYTAEVLVNSDSYGTTASTEVAFDIVEPLGEGEAEMFLAEFPDDAVARENFDWTLGFRNLSDRDSSVVTGIVTLDPAGADPVALDSPYRENVPAGGAIQVEKTDFGINRPGTYTYEIARIDADVTFTIGPPE
ncbi:hypothetical protein [Haloarcula salinisoli]|uniref:Uncharacterized protein n=1 Tax=Haloarcula salinisoli TaxID=2487746 RepID=A0A8J7YJ62_9EURY|nr:hypothetical protein [Halomicroarcula salinisoli]MBX0286990.1 hypothetical protein [Halomicroarcula salinisoli]MBX0304291.1 hypothetical protein [Halomicroarcula salinisoli]